MTRPQTDPGAPAPVARAGGLDWRDASHWSYVLAPCVHCQGNTHLRDDARRPSHKTCAEAAPVEPVSLGGHAPGLPGAAA